MTYSCCWSRGVTVCDILKPALQRANLRHRVPINNRTTLAVGMESSSETDDEGIQSAGAGVKRGAAAAAVPLPLLWGPAQPKVAREVAKETTSLWPRRAMTRRAAAADMRPPCTIYAPLPGELILVKKAWFKLSETQRDTAVLFMSERIEGAD